MDVKPIPGLEHLRFAEVWFHEVDDERFREASARAAQLGKTGLEVWTTDRTPEVVRFLEPRGYEEGRRYLVTELDVASAPPAPTPLPRVRLVTFAQRLDLACEAYPDQPGRVGTRLPPYEAWRAWGLDPHPPDGYFVALEGERAVGYGYLEISGDRATHGFMAVARTARGRGIAGAIKRAQIGWAAERGLRALRTATEMRLVGMRALNERLGYRLLYTEIVLRGPTAFRRAAVHPMARDHPEPKSSHAD
jgi:GNAT superfamily N-acetyltransferase